jgi:hypothetical protein
MTRLARERAITDIMRDELGAGRPLNRSVHNSD